MQDDDLIRRLTAARDQRLEELYERLGKLSEQWNGARLKKDMQLEYDVWTEMQEVQREIRKLEREK